MRVTDIYTNAIQSHFGRILRHAPVAVLLKDMIILVVSFSTYITWMTKTLTHFRTIVQLFKYILGKLEKTK